MRSSTPAISCGPSMQYRAAEPRRLQPMRTVTQPANADSKTGSSLTSVAGEERALGAFARDEATDGVGLVGRVRGHGR